MNSIQALEAYRRLCKHLDYDNDDYMFNGGYEEDNEVIENAIKDLEVLEIIKKHSFLFVEKGKLYVGRYADVELLIEEDDFDDKEEYELLKEVLGNVKN